MTDDKDLYFENGKFKKGHPGINQHTKPPPPPPTDAETDDFDIAILTAAQSFGTPKGKTKTGLPGYCNNLRDTRPQDFALLVAKALTRRTFAQDRRAAAIPITMEIVPCPSNFFMPYEEARASWIARTPGSIPPQLVVDNDTTTLDDAFSDAPDEPDDDA